VSSQQVIFVLGGPGSGKGTQCAKISRHFGLLHISAGELLREELKAGSSHGIEIGKTIREGKIVPSDVTVGLLARKIGGKTQSVLVDGFPRNQENNFGWERHIASSVDLRFLLHFDCTWRR